VVRFGIKLCMAMTLRLPRALRTAGEEDHRSVHMTVVLAIENYLAARATAEIKADPDTLRALAEARVAVSTGDVVYGTDVVHALVRARADS